MPDSFDQTNFGFDLGDEVPYVGPLPESPTAPPAAARVAYDLWLQLHAATERDRASQGSKAAATCPNCASDTAIPSFAEVKGNSHVLYTCIRCGEDYL